MAFPGGRFDVEAMREQARAKKAAAKRKAIISNTVSVVLLAAVAIGCWRGWVAWREHVEEQREEQRLREAQEARRQAEAEKKRKEEREAEKRRQEQLRREREEREAARKKAIEDEKIRLQEEKIRLEEEKLRQQEKEREEREWQEKNKSFADDAVKDLKFDPKDYVLCQAGCEEIVDFMVTGDRWESLSSKASAGLTIDFLRALNDGSVTNEFSETHYPDHAATRAILALAGKERFTMVFRQAVPKEGGKKNMSFVLLTADLNDGLALPKGGRELKGPGGAVSGYTAPFLFGRTPFFYVMRPATAKRLCQEWRKTRARIVKDAEKSGGADAYVKARLREEIGDFIASVRAEMATPEPEKPPEPPKEVKKPVRPKPKPLKGMSDLKSFK